MSQHRLIVLLAAGLLAPGWLAAQETRSMIFGRVLDPQASAVAGAVVTVANVDTGTSTILKTNETGYYEANFLLPGSYEVSAEASGFKKTVRRGITLSISTRAQIDLNLEIGALSESVSVTGEAPLLETNAVSAGRIMDSRSVLALPVQNKNTVLLMRFTPGIQTNGINEVASVYNTSNDAYGNLPGKVGGMEWSVDGNPSTGPSRQAAEQPFTDVIEEFKVETAAFDASIGHTLGINVAMKTKSGTNAFHGSLSELHWQQRWQGSGFFVKQLYYRGIAAAEAKGDTTLANSLRSQDKQPSGHSNNYSATFGGPVMIPKVYDGRNKLFFFFSFNGLSDIKSVQANLINHTVPTMANRTGDFSRFLNIDAVRYQIYDPLSVRPDPARPTHFIRDPIPGNILPASRMMNPGYKTYAKFLPTPNNDPLSPNLEPSNNYLAVGMPRNAFYKAFTNRVDYHLSDKHRFFGRWSWQRALEPGKDWTYESAPGLHDQQLLRHYRNAIVDWVYLASSATVLDISVAASTVRRAFGFTVPFEYKPSDVGLPAYVDARAGSLQESLVYLPVMAMSGYDTIGQHPKSIDNFRTFTTKAEVLHIRNTHTLRAGLDFRQAFQTGGGAGNTSGQFSFSNAYTKRNDDSLTPAGNLAHSWAAFMMGLPNGISIATADTFAMSSPYYGWFAQDNWRATPRLSLTFGLRLEYEQGPNERFDRVVGSLVPDAKLPITEAAEAAYGRSPVPELASSAFTVRGGSAYLGKDGASRRMIRSELMWLPRVAAAYQLTSKTVLRAGYGIFYDTFNVLGLFGYTYPDQTGYSRSTSTTVTNDFGMTWLAGDPSNGISPLKDPFPVRSDGTRFNDPVRDALGLMGRVGGGWGFTDFNIKHTRQQRWRAGVQRQFGNSSVVEIAYAGYYADRVPLSQTLSPLAEQYWASGLVRNDIIPSNLNSNVTNPFKLSNFASLQTSNPVVYQDMSSKSFYTSATIAKNQLLRPYPQFNGLTNNTVSTGKARSHAMELSYQRRMSKGFNVSVGYTLLRAREADFFYNEFDAQPSWRASNDGRPHRLVGSSVIELPFGKGRHLATKGPLSWLLGGFQVGVTYEFQQGPLLDWGNLFYYGNLEDINSGTRTLDRWFNTGASFERSASKGPASFQRRVFPTRIDGVRADMTNEWSGSLTRSFSLRESLHLQFRVDALNLQNRSQFAAPSMSPYSTDFGKITSQTAAMNRCLQIQARLTF